MTDRQPVALPPEAAYELLTQYFTEAIVPATHALYAEHVARMYSLSDNSSTEQPALTKLRSLLTDMPIILESFHRAIEAQHPGYEAVHPRPFAQPLEPIFIKGDPRLG